MPEVIADLASVIYGALVLGAGYVILWLRHFRKKDIRYFYSKMSAYDKALQSLIFGTISLAISSYVSRTSFEVLSDPSRLVQIQTLYNLIAAELLSVIYIVLTIESFENIWKKRKKYEDSIASWLIKLRLFKKTEAE